jgi:hypothetical protein
VTPFVSGATCSLLIVLSLLYVQSLMLLLTGGRKKAMPTVTRSGQRSARWARFSAAGRARGEISAGQQKIIVQQ